MDLNPPQKLFVHYDVHEDCGSTNLKGCLTPSNRDSQILTKPSDKFVKCPCSCAKGVELNNLTFISPNSV